tara:strand:+ start:1298 stop:1918 length:621 start_codon:yes stop_codon:yes gene_type:complete
MTTPAPRSNPDQVILTGAEYSVYSRICRITLRLKDVPHEFEMLDVFAENGPDKARQAGHPFGKIPVLHHGDLVLFETLAITRYIDDRFEGPPLQPVTPTDRARMNQIISIVDTRIYPVIVWGLHVPRSEDREPDPSMIVKGLAALDVLETLARHPWLCGEAPTLADAYLAACMDYVLDSSAGNQVSQHCPRLEAWWRRAQTLPAFC